jgi:predicted ATPase/class 3 adenylate cyclase
MDHGVAELGGAAGLLTVLFTDIVGFTELTAQRGDEYARATRNLHDELVRAQLRAHGGREIQTTDGGFLVTFRSVHQAVAGACAIQQAQLRHNRLHPDQALSVRLGLNAGEVSSRDDGLFGSAVNLAARVMAKARPGEILVSEVVKRLAGKVADVEFRDRGRFRLKGFPDRWRLYELACRALADRTPDDLPDQGRERLRVPGAVPADLPTALTPFVGRDAQLPLLQALVAQHRLLSLVGPAGVGKTRLGLALAAEVRGQFADGVRLVQLASINEGALLPTIVARALGITEEGGTDAMTQLVLELNPKSLLLVLDNCEHLLDHAAPLCDRLLDSCPGVSILTTSRERLGVPGERVWQVPPMELPEPGRPHAPADLAEVESVALFLDRARRLRPDFEIDDENAGTVAELVRRLEGLPLAIELAAAWAGVLSAAELFARVSDRFLLLTARDRVATPRHASLRAAIDSSYDALETAEQSLFRRLGLFVGGWTLRSIEAVCELDPAVALDLLARLIDRSLVTMAEPLSEPRRYRMLDSLREYAAVKLAEASELERVQRSYVDYFVTLAETAATHIYRPVGAKWLEVLDDEHDNCRAALEMALEADPVLAIRLASALGPFWEFRTHYKEGRWWLPIAIRAAPEGSAALAGALRGLGYIAWAEGDYAFADTQASRALDVSTRLGDRGDMVRALQLLAQIQFQAGDLAASRSLLQKALEIARRLPEKDLLGLCMFRLGLIAFKESRWQVAHDLLTQSVELARAGDDAEQASIATAVLGRLHLSMGRPDLAASILRTSLAGWREHGSPRQIAMILHSLAAVAAAGGEADRAARLAGAAVALRDLAGAPSTSALWPDLESLVEGVLSTPGAARAFVEGRQMERQAVIRFALGEEARQNL